MVESKSTLADIAKLAKVSVKTASRVVRQEPNVSPKTRAAVEKAMKILKYRPSLAPRAAVGTRSYLLGLIFDNPNPSYIVDLLRGALDQTRKEGYHLIVEPVMASSPTVMEDITSLLVQSNVDGMLLPPPLCDEPIILEALRASGKPFARIAPSVSTDVGLHVEMNDFEAARQMTQTLIALGHTSVGFVTGRRGTATTKRRLSGFLSAMRDANLTAPDRFIVEGTFEYRSGLVAGEALLRHAERPTAIFASNDGMAAGLIAAAHKFSLSVPDDVSIAGFDDSAVATVVWPPLTTVRQPIKEMAAAAVRMLIEQLRGRLDPASSTRELPFELMIRASTTSIATRTKIKAVPT